MKCPYCSGEMQAGYIQCRDGIYWSPKIRKVAALPPHGGEVIALGQDSPDPFRGCAVVAHHYSACQKIIIADKDTI